MVRKTASKAEKQEKREPKEKNAWKVRNSNRLTYMEKKELSSLGEELPALEEEIQKLNAEIVEYTHDFDKMMKASALRDQKEQELEEKTLRWMELEEKKETQ